VIVHPSRRCVRCAGCDCVDCFQVDACGCDESCASHPDHQLACRGLTDETEVFGNSYCLKCRDYALRMASGRTGEMLSIAEAFDEALDLIEHLAAGHVDLPWEVSEGQRRRPRRRS
jgi:hypothetical protein